MPPKCKDTKTINDLKKCLNSEVFPVYLNTTDDTKLGAKNLRNYVEEAIGAKKFREHKDALGVSLLSHLFSKYLLRHWITQASKSTLDNPKKQVQMLCTRYKKKWKAFNKVNAASESFIKYLQMDKTHKNYYQNFKDTITRVHHQYRGVSRIQAEQVILLKLQSDRDDAIAAALNNYAGAKASSADSKRRSTALKAAKNTYKKYVSKQNNDVHAINYGIKLPTKYDSVGYIPKGMLKNLDEMEAINEKKREDNRKQHELLNAASKKRAEGAKKAAEAKKKAAEAKKKAAEAKKKKTTEAKKKAAIAKAKKSKENRKKKKATTKAQEDDTNTPRSNIIAWNTTGDEYISTFGLRQCFGHITGNQQYEIEITDGAFNVLKSFLVSRVTTLLYKAIRVAHLNRNRMLLVRHLNTVAVVDDCIASELKKPLVSADKLVSGTTGIRCFVFRPAHIRAIVKKLVPGMRVGKNNYEVKARDQEVKRPRLQSAIRESMSSSIRSVNDDVNDYKDDSYTVTLGKLTYFIHKYVSKVLHHVVNDAVHIMLRYQRRNKLTVSDIKYVLTRGIYSSFKLNIEDNVAFTMRDDMTDDPTLNVSELPTPSETPATSNNADMRMNINWFGPDTLSSEEE